MENTKGKILLVCICILYLCASCFMFNVTTASASASSSNNMKTNNVKDNDVLRYYRKPSLRDNFKDDVVNVILKSEYSGQVGFDDFKSVNSIAEVIAIKHKLKTIYKGSDEKFTVSEGKNDILVLTLSTHNKTKVLKVAEKLQKIPVVLVAEPEYLFETVSCATVNDARYDEQWGLNDTYGINIEGAWDYTKGDYSVKVGIIDKNVLYNHRELSGLIYNGNLPNSTADDHGTHVAGIIGARMDNYAGTAGVAKCTMYMLNKYTFVDSLEYASANGIKITNASFQFLDSDLANGQCSSYYAAIRDYNGLLICAAGNSNANIDTNPTYPASYDLPNIITVGAIDRNGAKSSDSNYGATSVDIFAPGGNILSTLADNTYGCKSGTSMAAPHVTGVAALLLAQNPSMTAFDLKYTIMQNVDTSSELSNFCVSGGRLNAYKAVSNPHVNHSYVTEYTYIDDLNHQERCLCGEVTTKPHGYNARYRYIDGKFHRAFCGCGIYATDMHVIKASDTGSVKTCILCLRQVDQGITIYSDALNALLVTDNGSYILPSGITVLVDEDIESYLNGTLIFKVNRNHSVA